MNYRYIDLIKNPLNETFSLEFNGEDFWHTYTDVHSVLNKELLDQLIVEPCLVVIFAAQLAARTVPRVHTDLTWHKNKWAKVPCAINWELQPTLTKVKWYDTRACKEFWPDSGKDTFYPYNLLHGIGYETHRKSTDPLGSILLEETIFDSSKPVLFRTDVAHSLTFNSQTKTRFMCSIRFDLDQIPTWDHAIKIFENLLVD